MGNAPQLIDAPCTPGVAAIAASALRKPARIAAGLVIRLAGEREKPKNITFCGLNPGSTFHSCSRLRSVSPAPISRTSASAISTTTKTPCAPFRAPLAPRPPSFKLSCTFVREIFSAGARPKRIPASRAIDVVKSSTRRSMPTSPARGKVSGSAFRAACVPQPASSKPSAPPRIPNKTLSVKSWRIKRAFPAPSAARTANSLARPLARASRRFAIFAQAISNTKPTAQNSTSRIGFTSPSIRCLNGISAAPIPLFTSG